MILPADITEQEMRDIIRSIWSDYYPNESTLFLDELNDKELRLLIELISTKDNNLQKEKWDNLNQSYWDSKDVMKRILQQAKILNIKIREQKESEVQMINDIF